MKRACKNCRYYIENKSILSGLGMALDDCKKDHIDFDWDNAKGCADYKCNRWRSFWNIMMQR